MTKISPCATLSFVVILLFPIFFQAVGIPKTLSANADSGTTRKVEFTQLWSFESDWTVVTRPVFADGLVYVTSGSSGGATATLYCINASSGTQVWNSTGLFHPYTVANGYIYIGGSFWDASTSWTLQGVLSCLNAYDGTQIWNYSYGTSFTTPVVDGDVVYVPGFNYTMSTGINMGFIYAFNALTGAKIWDFQGSADTRFDYDSLLLTGANLYVLSAAYSEQDASWSSGIYSLNAYTGEEQWSYITPGQFSAFAVAGQTVYISSNFVDTTDYLDAQDSGGYVYDGGVLALNAFSGIKMWEYPIKGSVESPILGNDMVYAVSNNGEVYALNALDGTEIWKHATETNLGHGLLANGYLYVGSSEGVYCFNTLNGDMIWNFRAEDYAVSSATFPEYADGVIYVGWNGPQFFSSVTQHDFYALDALTGEKIGNYTLRYTVQNSPVVINSTVYIGASWVTEENPDYTGPGAVIALNSTISLSPQPSTPSSALAVTLIAIVVIALTVGLLLYRKHKRRLRPHL